MTIAQKLANSHSDVGSRQILVGIYNDEAVIYAQVADATAEKITHALTAVGKVATLTGRARSADGLTCCWTFARKRPGRVDWLPLFMMHVSPALIRAAGSLCPNKQVDYIDNRQRDHCTLESYASLLA